jgi:hypothetical protein
MSLLEHPTAQALLADAEVSAAAVAGCRREINGVKSPFLSLTVTVSRAEFHESKT